MKDKNLTQKISKILLKKQQLERVDLTSDLRRADEYVAELESSRDLSQTVIHIDCDAFYAAVEELDRPELKDVPMAVGKGVLTTCNYHARKFGCRSGMAGFVAAKLCPQLISLPLNFPKYIAIAKQVRDVLGEYDSNFESAGLDEAYLNITQYCQEKQMDAEDVVSQLRNEVHEKTKITISAGIAANAKIAKIASNRNKPNGQFRIANDRTTIMEFMRDLPTRKVNGVGRVFERELDAVGIKTCGDIYGQRAYLCKLFGEKAFQFLMQCYLGLGRTKIKPAEDCERKSVGTESTFRDMSDGAELRAKLRWIAEELEKDLARTQFKGRTLVLKLKLHTYEVLTRQVIPPKAVSAADDLYTYSLPMLAKLERENPGLKLRLMGLRCTNLVSTKKHGIDFFGTGGHLGSSSFTVETLKAQPDQGEWEVWPEEEFESAARQEREDDMNELEQLSQEHRFQEEPRDLEKPIPLTPPSDKIRSKRHAADILSTTSTNTPTDLHRNQHQWSCPVCARAQPPGDKAFNEHIDFCLSRQTIRDAVRASSPPLLEKVEEAGKIEGLMVGKVIGGGRGRGRGKRKGVEGGVEEKRQRLLFLS